MSVSSDPADAPHRRTAGLTDARGEFTYADRDVVSSSQRRTVLLDVDAYFASLGIVAGYQQIALVVRIFDCDHEQHVVITITPFLHTTWYVR